MPLATRKIFWLGTVAIVILIMMPHILMNGMFMDGVIYAAIAKNMAEGLGSLWRPFFMQTGSGIFHEHPPLVFWIQSWFFRLLGNGIYTERIYTFFTALITLFGVVKCWQLFALEKWRQHLDWLPVLLIFTVPVFSWSYKNNLLENTMGVFTLFAVYCISYGLEKNRKFLFAIGSGLIVPALLSKGVVGLFPLAVPMIHWLVFKKYTFFKTIVQSLFITIFPAGLFYLLLQLSPGAMENISAYLGQQLVPALNGKRVTTSNRFRIMGLLLFDLTFPICFLFFYKLRSRFKGRKIDWSQKKAGLFFLLIGLSASLPLMASLKQRKFYAIPAIPFFILGISFLLAPYIYDLFKKLSQKSVLRIKWLVGSLLVLGLLISIFSIGKFSRDEDRLRDVIAISKVIPPTTIITISNKYCRDWGLQAALMRTGGITLACNKKSSYLLVSKEESDWEKKFPFVEEIDLNLKVIRLFRVLKEE